MEKKNEKKVKNRKVSTKDWNKIWLITLLILLALEVVLIPCLIYAEVKRILPIIAFLVLPTAFGIIILYLSRNCTVDYQKKKERLAKQIDKNA